ncbi:MAG: phosphate signaling complex protein PhoU [bacterium]|nr:phosphate signaling complex protein PhoU [bacterium]
MSNTFETEVEKLKKGILGVGTKVEESLRTAMQSFFELEADSAESVIEKDPKIDIEEVAVEEECIKILALYQPFSNQLRYLITVLKINNDLERIGDLAVNIAHRALDIQKYPRIPHPLNLRRMADLVENMLDKALDAFIKQDAELARKVCFLDDEVDQLHRDSYPLIAEAIKQKPEAAEYYLHILSVSRYLERCADQVTNIAEDVIYLVEGKIVRHYKERFKQTTEG